MTTEKGRVTMEYLSTNPDLPSRSIAMLLRDDHPYLFNSVENARRMVRYYRRQDGDANRKKVPADAPTAAANGDLRRGDPTAGVLKPEAKFLIFDIETSPMLALPWGCFKQYINPEQLLAPQKVLCWAAGWLGEDHVHFSRMEVPDKGEPPDDPRVALPQLIHDIADFYALSDKDCVEELWKLFDEADIVVAHNGKAFDISQMASRWAYHDLPPPSPYQVVDTLHIASRKFRLPRNKLESIGIYFELGQKTEHEGFNLWVKCMRGRPKAWKKMETYNIQDVELLESAYLKMRPWADKHPNVALCYDNQSMRCTRCGSQGTLRLLPSTAKTAASEFDAYRCTSCGATQRSRSRHKPTCGADERMANVV